MRRLRGRRLAAKPSTDAVQRGLSLAVGHDRRDPASACGFLNGWIIVDHGLASRRSGVPPCRTQGERSLAPTLASERW
jgi:hypothetical protein